MSLSMISLYRSHIFDVHTPKYVYDIFIYRLMVNKDMMAQSLDKEQLYGMFIMLNLSMQVQKNHSGFVPSFISYHWVCSKSNTMGVTCRAAITFPSWVSEFNHGFSGVRGARFLVFCVLFCRSLFALFDLFSFSFDHCIVCPSSNEGY